MNVAAALLLVVQLSAADWIAEGKKLYGARKFGDALAAFEKARDAAEASGNAIEGAHARLGIAGIKTMRGEFDDGIALANDARAAFETAGDKQGLSEAYGILGNLNMGPARYADAAAHYRQCADLAEGARRATCRERQGEAEITLGQFRQAMATLRDAIDAAIATGNKPAHAAALGAMGDVHVEQGNGELAVHYHEQSMAMFREIGKPVSMSMQLNNLAICYHMNGRSERALEAYRENLALLEGLSYTRGIVVSKMNIAGVLVDLGRDEEAAVILNELLPVLAKGDDPDSAANVRRLLSGIHERRGDLAGAVEHALRAADAPSGDVKDTYLNLTLLGHLYRKLGRIDDARASLRKAIDLIESVHEQASGREVHFFDERTEPYSEMAVLLIGEGRVEEAFGYAERYRSRVLVDVLRGGSPPPLTSRLPREAVLVEYLVTAEKTYAFVIADGEIHVRPIDAGRDELARRAESFRALLADRRPDFRKDARALHQLLITPIADLLAKHKSWTLVPDGPLWNLPFQALVDARGSYLAEQAAIVYAPSLAAQLAMNALNGVRPHLKELLAFGNPTAPPSLDAVEGTRANLGPLPGAEAEVKTAARFYGADSAVYVRDEATEERFKAEAPRYRVLHIAGHGVLNDASPMHSYLLLAAGDAKKEDGYLEAGELMGMDLGADLVVLSACDTARGKYAAGEGIIGFSWALFAARCRTQVLSQWKVDSAATSVLMRNFHRNVRGDRTKVASALQKTIVSMLKTKEYRHPFYWAGFVVLGDAL